MNKRTARQQGAAMITVMLVIALVSVIAVNLGSTLQRQVSRSANLQQAEQSYWMWLSAEEVLAEVLSIELERSDGVVHLEQNWAQRQGPFPVEGGQIGAQIRDLRSCFNLNSLVPEGDEELQGEKRRQQFRLLLTAAEIDSYQAQQLTDALIDWIDEDTRLSQYGAEDADYESRAHPYQAANSALVDISELRQIRGFTPQIIERIKPLVCVIPGNRQLKVNINTLDPEHGALLVAISGGQLDLSSAAQILAGRPQSGYAEREEALSEGPLAGISDGEDGLLQELVVSSQYFQLLAFIQWGDVDIRARSILQVTPDSARVIYRAMGE
ncbi:type II secretion system minor pseudopilin GspK [Idiomarina seosinensis]|uniref:type II secretion system minor pseudopilin GspK n=1 Tax=Idiomarina seosinensis TaxID=281739 RepID=UPI003850E0C9